MTSSELLRLAADALEDGENPFSMAFLSRNDVTFDQCQNLAQQLAIGARMFATAITKPRSPAGTAMLIAIAENA